MKLFGSLKELVQIVFRKDSQEITVRPNQSTTYTAARDVQLPVGDSAHELVGTAATQSLTNKTIDADANTITNIENADIKAGAAVDRSKLAAATANNVVINDGSGNFSEEAQLAKSRGGTGADNTNVTFPATGTIVTEDGTQTLTNKALKAPSTTIEAADPGKELDFDLSSSASPSTTTIQTNSSASRTITLPDATTTLVGTDATQTLTNKTLQINDLQLQIQDAGDATKEIRIDPGGNTTGVTTTLRSNSGSTETINLPDGATTLVGTDTTQALSNKQLQDSSVSFRDNIDSSKQLVFDVGGNSASAVTTIRTNSTSASVVDVPAGSTTLVGDDTSQVLTNKTIDGDDNTIQDVALSSLKADAANDDELVYRSPTTGAVTSQTVNDFTVAAAVDANADYVLMWDASAGAHRKALVTDIGGGGASINTDTNTVTDANYTILDGDGYRNMLFSTGASNRTCTLPTAADNTDRLILIKKIDSGIGTVTVDGEGAETIDDSSTLTLNNQYDSVTLVCDGTEWHTVDSRQATSSSSGTVTSYSPIVDSSVHSLVNSGYTILDDDGYETLLFSTGNDPRSCVLPTVADNAGRKLTIKKMGAGTGALTIDGEGVEEIEGETTLVLRGLDDAVTIISDGTEWHIINKSSNRWQKNRITTDITSNTTDIAALRFSNLITGKVYKVTAQVALLLDSNADPNQAFFDINHNGTTQARMLLRNDADGAQEEAVYCSINTIFEAAASTVTFDLTFSGSTTGTLEGNGSAYNQTWTLIEELNNYDDETTAF